MVTQPTTKSDLLALFPAVEEANDPPQGQSKNTDTESYLIRAFVAAARDMVHGARSVPLAARAVTVFWQQR